PEISTLSLHDALPILAELVVLSQRAHLAVGPLVQQEAQHDGRGLPIRQGRAVFEWRRRIERERRCSRGEGMDDAGIDKYRQCRGDRKSTRLNSSHVKI